MMQKKLWIALGLVGLALHSGAAAKINYTSIDGRQMCCDSVGPSGYAAQGCSGNPGGAACAAIAIEKDAVYMDRTGAQVRHADATLAAEELKVQDNRLKTPR